MSVIPISAPVKRDPGPYPAKRTCESCGAFLSRSNPSTLCAPCNGGDWYPPVEIHPAFTARREHEAELAA